MPGPLDQPTASKPREDERRDRPAWLRFLGGIYHSVGRDNVPLLAAGLAFYGMLALFPGLIAAITLYGLVADPVHVQQVVQFLTGQLTGGAGKLVEQQLNDIVQTSHSALGWGLAVALGAALWSASTGTLNLLKAVNAAYDVHETRGFFHLRGLAIMLTAGAIAFVLVAVTLIAVLPAVVGFLGLEARNELLVRLLRWPLLLAAGMLALNVVYGIGPNRQRLTSRWTFWGAGAAVIMWLAASWGFSYYIEHLGNFNETYGSLGSVVVLLLWFYVTSFSVLLGAEIGALFEEWHGEKEDAA